MTYTEVGFCHKSGFKKIVLTEKLVLVGFSPKSAFKKIVLTQKLVLVLNQDSDDLHRSWL